MSESRSKPPRLGAAERARLGRELRARYQAGATLRDLAGQTGYSYGLVRGLVIAAGVILRSRGGPNRTRGTR
ncbi:MAG: helix-turn-helix domain-containing protein [Pseudonocardiaceae bacterium]